MFERAHYQALLGGVNLTTTKMQRRYWIPKLRQLTCHGCRRFHTTACVAPIPGYLLPDRTNGRRSFQVVGLEFAGPMIYKGKKDSLKQASSSRKSSIGWSSKDRRIHKIIKRFVVRRGRPERIYSDNAKQQQVGSSLLENQN